MNAVLRTDLLDHAMNAGKEQKVKALLRAWRDCAVDVGREQWRLFFETGSFNKNYRNKRESRLSRIVGAANRLQKVRYQVVGILDSCLSNRQNDFSRIVERSTLSEEIRHRLLCDYDRRITRLAAHRQRQGLRTQSPRYDRYVRQLRGFLRTEINRVLNRLAEVRRPGRIVVEKLYFSNPNLSRRMNRLVTNAGRRIIEEKLQDLEERYGIEIEYVNPAYSSQTCSACGYVDEKNRTGERFECLWCGRVLHADVNAARNLGARRSRPELGSVRQTKAAVLRA